MALQAQCGFQRSFSPPGLPRWPDLTSLCHFPSASLPPRELRTIWLLFLFTQLLRPEPANVTPSQDGLFSKSIFLSAEEFTLGDLSSLDEFLGSIWPISLSSACQHTGLEQISAFHFSLPQPGHSFYSLFLWDHQLQFFISFFENTVNLCYALMSSIRCMVQHRHIEKTIPRSSEEEKRLSDKQWQWQCHDGTNSLKIRILLLDFGNINVKVRFW